MVSLDILFAFFAIEFFVVMLNAIADWKPFPIGVKNKVSKGGQAGFGIIGFFLLFLAFLSGWAAFDTLAPRDTEVLTTFKGEEGTEVTAPIKVTKILWFTTGVEPNPTAELIKDWEGLEPDEQRDRLVEQMPYLPDDAVVRYKPPDAEDFKLVEWGSLTESEWNYLAEYIIDSKVIFDLPVQPEL